MAKQKTHVNIEELIKFANSLKSLSNTLKEYFKETDRGLSRLGESHQDAKYDEFKLKFDADLKTLKPLSEVLDKYHHHILKKWGPIIRDYLDAKMHK